MNTKAPEVYLIFAQIQVDGHIGGQSSGQFNQTLVHTVDGHSHILIIFGDIKQLAYTLLGALGRDLSNQM